MRVLFCATLASHIKNFHLPLIEELSKEGYVVDVVTNGVLQSEFINETINVPFSRSVFSVNNLFAYFKLRKILLIGKYDIISTHTPIASFLTRLAARKTKVKVIYMAHGFHFYGKKGLLFKFAEKMMAHNTDVLITINQDDYQNAKCFKLKNQDSVLLLLKGVGVDTRKFLFNNLNKTNKVKELGFNSNDVFLLSVGELNKNKNHKFIIETLLSKKIFEKYGNLKYLICGSGKLEKEYRKIIKANNLENTVFLLGYREDISEIMKLSDIFVFPSIREGLPSSLIEAMASGLPIICSNIRGNRDLVKNGKNGFLYNNFDSNEFISCLEKMLGDKELMARISSINRIACLSYDVKETTNELIKYYNI